MKSTLFAFLLAVGLVSGAAPAMAQKKPAAPAKGTTSLVCVTEATGAIVVRTKCKTTEKALDLNTLPGILTAKGAVGPKGDKGDPGLLDTGSCKKQSVTVAPAPSGIAVASLNCQNPTGEIMVAHGWFAADPQGQTIRAFLQRDQLSLTGSVPTGTTLETRFDAGKPYFMTLEVVCCAG